MQTLAHELKGRFRIVGRQARHELDAFAADVRDGLTQMPKRLSPRYLYDRRGSWLFERICSLDEYYLTRAETQIIERYQDEILDGISGCSALVELGSGSSVKTAALLGGAVERGADATYVPIDVSREMLAHSAAGLLRRFPSLNITALAAEYADALEHVAAAYDEPKCVMWLGSSIGNLEREDAARFLARARRLLSSDDRVLIGIDLRKDPAAIQRAYDDAQNVTARFNRNVLRRINRELGGDFDLTRFAYRATYDADRGRVDMFQVSRCTQTVEIARLGLRVGFEDGEPILTESSLKYSIADIDALAGAVGMCVDRRWVNRDKAYSLNLFRPDAG